MLGLPQKTDFNKRIPKQTLIGNSPAKPEIKRLFDKAVSDMWWRNKISVTTVNAAKGKAVEEIEIIELRLKTQIPDERIFRLIDGCIPYHIVFAVVYEDKYQLWTAFKEIKEGSIKTDRYFCTDWLPENRFQPVIEGGDMDAIYENMVKRIAGAALPEPEDPTEDLKDTVERGKRAEKLRKQIASLEKKMRKEKQLNRQTELNTEIKKLRRELERLR